jgi:ATP-binding cassette subfamily F protein 3
MEFHGLEVYRGNYSHYVRQREERRERLLKEYEAQQEFIAKEEEYIRRHMGSRWTAQAKGRMKKLQTMQKRGKIIDRPRHRKQMSLRMQAKFRSGDLVLRTRGLKVGYHDDQKVLLDVPDITLIRGETAALIGPNGVGKTTFLKTITGQLDPLGGEVKVGANVDIGYFAQAHERLNPHNTLVEEIQSVKYMPTSEARHYLGKFLFSGEDGFRTVSTLSGGERGRIALAKLALSGANFLLLDEPTNHLDIDSQEIIEEVLDNFNGTILLVSHDRYLIDALATQIWAAEPGKLEVFEGSYQDYITARNQRLEREKLSSQDDSVGTRRTLSKTTNHKRHGLNPYELKRRLGELEQRIAELEAQMDELTAAIEQSSANRDANQVRELGERYTLTEQELASLLDEWAQLAE